MFENLPLSPPIEPMEATSVKAIPRGDHWLYEPKWDGFRCIAFRDGREIALQSKSGQPLARYFPEIVASLLELKAHQFILDGELIIKSGDHLDFDALLQRIHPAESRVRKLSMETPARYAIFDALALPSAPRLFESALSERRSQLDRFSSSMLEGQACFELSPATPDFAAAEAWLGAGTARYDGVIAKRADTSYRFGERDAVMKVKRVYTADCVVGGFRLAKDNKTIASLLLGLYDDAGLLHLVGFVGSMSAAERMRAAELLKPIVAEPGFTGARPGGPSRWGPTRAEWFPVSPKVVVEVQYDHVTGARFRHGARLRRWRPDKTPAQCTMDQMLHPR